MSGKSLGQTLYEAAIVEAAPWDCRSVLTQEDYERKAAAVVAAHEASRWRKVEDGLPEVNTTVITHDGKRWRENSYHVPGGNADPFWMTNGKWTHWMLPAPPGGE